MDKRGDNMVFPLKLKALENAERRGRYRIHCFPNTNPKHSMNLRLNKRKRRISATTREVHNVINNILRVNRSKMVHEHCNQEWCEASNM